MTDALTALPLPETEAAWKDWVPTRCRDQLRVAGETVEALKQAAPGDGAILQLWNDASIALGNAFAAASLLSQVHPEADVRELAENAEQDAHRFSTDLMLDRAVFDQLSSIRTDPLDEGARRMLADALRSFRRSGVDRDEETRTRLRAINERETELGQAFSRGIRDGRRTTTVPAAALAGLPEDFVADHPADASGNVTLTTEYPDTVPFLTFAESAEARRAVQTSAHNVGWPGNDAVLVELLTLRDEHARLLGYASWPDYDTEVKMIGTGPAIGEFIDRIAADALSSGQRDLVILQERAREDDPEAVIDTSNSKYYAEVVRRERFDVDAQQVRAYFDFGKVRQGLLEVTGRLFGVEYTEVPDAPVWHEEVTTYDVHLDGAVIGRIRLDLHPREGKFNHAAQFDLVPGVQGRQLAEGVLVCNFPRGLMEHGDVVTLFHEFGHLLHHVLAGRHEWVRFSGVATEWDFVEAPSQLLEEWAWDAGVLRSFATNAAGESIPEELVAKMRAGVEFGKGYLERTQMFYAAVSYLLHLELPEDISARVAELQAKYSLVAPLPDTHFHASFGHLEGYSSGYYTYAWSLVIAKDLFSAFDPGDLFAAEVAQRYRDKVLVPGGSRDAAVLVADFLGRPYSSEAFKTWLER